MADRGAIGGLGQIDGTADGTAHGTGFAPSPGAVTNGGGSYANAPGLPTIAVALAGTSGTVVVSGGQTNSVVIVDG